MTVKKKSRQMGFAVADPARQREIASMGGKAAHQMGRAHQFTTSEAREAGRKGAAARLARAAAQRKA